MKAIFRKTLLLILSMILSTNIYANAVSVVFKTTVRQFLKKGTQQTLEQIAKGASNESIELFSRGLKMNYKDVMAELSVSNARISSLLNKKNLTADEFNEVSEAIADTVQSLRIRGKSGLSYRKVNCKNANSCGVDLKGRDQLVFIPGDSTEGLALYNKEQRKNDNWGMLQKSFKLVSSSRGRNFKVMFKVAKRIQDEQYDKLFFFFRYIDGHAGKFKKKKQKLSQLASLIYSDKQLKRGKLIIKNKSLKVDQHVLKIMDLVLQTKEENIGAISKILDDANSNIDILIKEGKKLSKDDKAEEIYKVFAKKNKKAADALREGNCFWP